MIANITTKVGGLLFLFAIVLRRLYEHFPCYRAAEDGQSVSIPGSLFSPNESKIDVNRYHILIDMRTAAQKFIPTTPGNYYFFVE